MKYVFPENYDTAECVLVPINTSLIPFVAGALKIFEQRRTWQTETDYERGYNAFVELQIAMAGKCIQALIDSNDRIYRLLDSALNGTAYTVTPAEEPPPAPAPDPTRPTIAPAIPDAPPANPPIAPGLRARFERLVSLQDNFNNGRVYGGDLQNPLEPALSNDISMRQQLLNAQGIINAGWFGIGGQPAKISDIVNALRIGNSTDQGLVNDALQEILGAGSDTASIFNTVRGLLSDTVSGVTEGGILATLIASSIANAAIAGATAAQLDRIIASLDGGAPIRPGDNLLQALRGDTLADGGERNVVRQLELIRQTEEATQNALITIGNAQTAALSVQADILAAIRDALRSSSPDEALISVVQQIRQNTEALSAVAIAPLIDEVEALLTDIRTQTS